MTPTTTRTRLACLVLAAGLALSGCGGGPEEVPAPTTSSIPSTTAAPTTQEPATDDVAQTRRPRRNSPPRSRTGPTWRRR